MPTYFDLDRFLQAQDPVMPQVHQELRAGCKRSHWMWFVFPQLRGLGHSPMARHYGIVSLAEGEAYLAHHVLGPRLIECTAIVNVVEQRSVRQIFGSPDDLKFHSSMTLFALVAGATSEFRRALEIYFSAAPDPLTSGMLGTRHAAP